ncbi:Na/Pi cotransporter family protein [Pseudokordiimonas caeni]|uniref:Na/Pi cotransporter family protein n=1 Tax=Pseudokordiimonas caeni TaxID=2997908 RepID=UPI0028128875|nr:Na/Pi symporter [Pseudokordiimonas caeni]
MTLVSIGQLIGGLGLFLLALSMMTSGLELAMGGRLKSVLAASLRPAWKALFAGFAATAIVQASGAVSVVTLGFVNAGLITLADAFPILLGSNVGTTVTGWIVAALGFKVDIHMIALPMIGLGMLWRMVRTGHPSAGIGTAVAGFGLFFLGLDALKAGFDAQAGIFSLSLVEDYGERGILIGLVAGAFLTVLAQSSSATIALVLTAAESGLIAVPTAAAMVVGANIGTSTTALIASIGATSGARRTALAQFFFNLATGLLAAILLMLFLPFWGNRQVAHPAIALAIFDTLFNIGGVVLVWPFRRRLTDWLDRWYKSAAEDRRRPQHIDRSLIATPSLAVVALQHEARRLIDFTVPIITRRLPPYDPTTDLTPHSADVDILAGQIFDYAAKLGQTDMSADSQQMLLDSVHATQDALEAATLLKGAPRLEGFGQAAPLALFADAIRAALATGIDGEALEANYQALRHALIDAMISGRAPQDAASDALELVGDLYHATGRVLKARTLTADAAAEAP